MNNFSKFDSFKQAIQIKTPSFQVDNYYRFWDIPAGKHSIIRFLPDLDNTNPQIFLKKLISHRVEKNGQLTMIPCLKNWDDNAECPFCELSRSYYKAKDTANGKKYWRVVEYLANVLIISDGIASPANNCTGEVKAIKLRSEIYDRIVDEINAGLIEDLPSDYETGTHFIIKKTSNGKYADYSKSTFESAPYALDANMIELVTGKLIDLSTLIPPKPDIADYQAMVTTIRNGDNAEGFALLAKLKAKRAAEKAQQDKAA